MNPQTRWARSRSWINRPSASPSTVGRENISTNSWSSNTTPSSRSPIGTPTAWSTRATMLVPDLATPDTISVRSHGRTVGASVAWRLISPLFPSSMPDMRRPRRVDPPYPRSKYGAKL